MINNIFSEKNFKYFCIIFFVICLCYLSLLRIDDYFYADDNIRKAYGGAYFKALSRYTSEYLSYSFTLPARNFYTIAPLSQIFAIITLSFSGLILNYIFNEKITIYSAIIASIIGIYPFFFQSMMYSFDAFFMGLSIFFSIFPFVFYKNYRIFIIVSIVSLLGVLTTYQLSSGIYPALLLLLISKNYFFDNKNNFKEILKILCAAIAAYLISLVIFKVLIYKEFNGHLSTEMLSFRELYPAFFMHVYKYLHYIKTMLGKSYILYFSIFLCVYFIVKGSWLQQTIRKKLLVLLLLSFTLILAVTASAGISLMMKTYPTQVRYIIGFNIIIASTALILSEYANKAFKFLLLIFLVNLLALGNILGNSINDQWQYDKFRLMSAINSISDHLTEDYKITIIGNPQNKVSFNQKHNLYPIVKTLTDTSNLRNYGGSQIFERYLPLQKGNIKCADTKEVGDILNINIFNKIYKNGNCYTIEFK